MSFSEIILASSSLYRRELLQRILESFQVLSPDVDEHSFHAAAKSPDDLAQQLARAKATAVFQRSPGALVIGSDQLVDLDGDILGKPMTSETAEAQLTQMSGRTHRLLTAVCVLGPTGAQSFIDETRLTMRTLTQTQIQQYVARDLPLDCAGSYRIERLGISLFNRIETEDFTAIMGLPLMRLSGSLRDFGVNV